MLVQQGDDLRCAVPGHVGSGSIEPDNDWKLRILGEEFFDLWDGLGVEIAVEITVLCRIPVVGCGIMIAGFVGGSARRGPILVLGVVKAELHPLLPALFAEFAEWVALKGSCGNNVERVCIGVEHGEAVVVLGGDDDILHPRGLGEGHNIPSAEAGGIELGREGLVLRDRDRSVIHNPLADAGDLLSAPGARGDGVKAPVDEHTEAGFAPPLHPDIAPGGALGVLHGGDRMMNGLRIRLAALQLCMTQ